MSKSIPDNKKKKKGSSKTTENDKKGSDENFSSSIKQQQSIPVPNLDLHEFTEINQSGYFINYNKSLGVGRYGQVYEGYSEKIQLKMAVKKIPQMTQNGTNIAVQTKIQIDILKKICQGQIYHKNVLRYYHYQSFDGYFYLFIELCEKGSLKQYVDQKRTQMSQKQFFRILKSIVQGMIFINKKFIIHRDIKPANILVNSKDQIIIGDFGISKQIPFRDQMLTIGMCTPHYGAPEILREQQFYTYNVDVWSCGIMMYELIQNKSIYFQQRPKNKKQLIAAIKFFEETQNFFQISNPNISEKFQKILKKMLIIDKQKRPAFEQIQKYIEYEELVKFYQLQDIPGLENQSNLKQNVNSPLAEYNEQQKQKYLKILKKYTKYKRQKIGILLNLQKKFMNKPFQVLWNVQKFILKYLTLNMYIVKAQQYFNWLHVSLNDNIISLESQLKIKISQFRFNYHLFAQVLREEKKKIDCDIRKYYKSISSQAEKIQFEYLDRQKQSQRIRSYMDVNILEDLFSHTRKNVFLDFTTYHQIYKSLIELKHYYLTYEHVQALPTFEDKQIYFSILLVYYYDKFFNEQHYVKQLLMEEQIASTQKDKQIKLKRNLKDQVIGANIYPRSLQTSITGTMSQSICDFKQRMEDQKQMMKWIRRHNLSRHQVFSNKTLIQYNDNLKSSIGSQRKIQSPTNNIKISNKQNKSNTSKFLDYKQQKIINSNSQQENQEGPQAQVIPSTNRRLINT